MFLRLVIMYRSRNGALFCNVTQSWKMILGGHGKVIEYLQGKSVGGNPGCLSFLLRDFTVFSGKVYRTKLSYFGSCINYHCVSPAAVILVGELQGTAAWLAAWRTQLRAGGGLSTTPKYRGHQVCIERTIAIAQLSCCRRFITIIIIIVIIFSHLC